MHLELLYCPFGTESEFTNPFANQDLSMTSLEKALKSEASETDVTDIDKMSKHRKKDAIVRGVLSVTVISAQDLPSMDVLGKADPYVVLSMKKTETKNKTRVTISSQ